MASAITAHVLTFAQFRSDALSKRGESAAKTNLVAAKSGKRIGRFDRGKRETRIQIPVARSRIAGVKLDPPYVQR